MEYDDLIKRLRTECILPYATLQLMREAADTIEKLLDFAHYIASEVVVPDDEWEVNYTFPEIVSRKLFKLGIIEKDGAFWHYDPPYEETEGDDE